MSAMQNELNPQVMLVPIGTQAATATVPGPAFPKASRIKKVALINGAALAADDTNYLVVTLQRGATVLATISTKLTGGVGSLAANVALYSADVNIDIAAADQLKVVATKNGTGVPTSAVLQLEWFPK